jgi:hypothetical protein
MFRILNLFPCWYAAVFVGTEALITLNGGFSSPLDSLVCDL